MNTMDQLLDQLRNQFPDVTYRDGPTFYWSPKTNEVIYISGQAGNRAQWSLLHETSHALLGHASYQTDFELIGLEVAAWEKAKELGSLFGITIDEDHIQDCLDSYRDWMYARSICPQCGNKSLQQADLKHYQCFNCHAVWRVTPSRFCRSYRSTKRAGKLIGNFDALAYI